jgi:hypothetical protein
MANEIIPYLEMCQREGLSLQRGMNFQAGKGYSIILMSIRKTLHTEIDSKTMGRH